MARKSWFASNKRGSAAEISIYSDIGAFGVTAADFRKSLDAIGDARQIDLFISSDGGDIATGFAIYNMLERHKARKHVTIDGLAASMASVIAMVGDEIVMPANSMLMIHNPFGAIAGGSEQILSFGKALESMRANIIGAYAKRTGLDRDRIAAMMDAETWLDADESVALGFADSVAPAQQMAAQFDVARFRNVPATFGRAAKAKPKSKARNEFSSDFTDRIWRGYRDRARRR